MPAALAAALAFSGSVVAAPTGQVTEFPTTTAGSAPEGIVAGPDGHLWFAELLANHIAEVNPATGTVTEFTPPTANSGPLGVALGRDGNIWFTEVGAGKIGEINPVTHAVSDFAITTSSSGPVAIVQGPNGNMWFTESANPGKIGEINPTTHAITEFAAATANVTPFGIAVGPDGNIWYTEKDPAGPTSKIGVINPNTGATTDFAITASSQPNAIAAGPDGSLWVTLSAPAVSQVALVNTTTDTLTPFTPPSSSSSPTVIVPGPDGSMWFTENGDPGHVAEINPVTHAITEFATPTANSGPVGIAVGADGNLWLTESKTSKVGLVGAGAPAPAVAAPAVAGSAQQGQTLTCQAATWSSWAGQQPAFGFGFDGFRWLLDGSQIAGATTQTLALAASDVGHRIACQEIATYPLVAATVSGVSQSLPISPSLGASLVSTSTMPTTLRLTISCVGLPTQTCSGHAALTTHVTTQGSKIIAVTAKTKSKPKPPKKVRKVETVASGSYSIPTGKTGTLKLLLNRSGKKLLAARYKLPARLTLTGTAATSKTVTFSYGRLHIQPSYQWAFSKTFAFATQLTLGGLPRGLHVALVCKGRGCPFSKRTFAPPKHGKLQLAPALKQRHLHVGATVDVRITATNDIGEVVRFTVLAGKLPKESFLCLPPGARTPSVCVS